jgi:hypothetical protein
MQHVRPLSAARLSTVLLVGLSLFLAAPAIAQCPPGSSPFTGTLVDPTFELEGAIDSVSLTDRTISTNGTTFRVPVGMLISTGLPQGITLECLVQPATTGCFPAGSVPANPRSVIGGTIIATGTIDNTTNPGCLTYVPEAVSFLFAENVVVGALTSVTPPNAITVHEATVRLNTDPRLPADVVDGAGVRHALADLQGHQGELVEVEGYYDAAADVLYATLVQLDAVLPSDDGTDVISISRAEWRDDKNELRVEGSVVPAAAMPANVSLYAPGTLNAAGTGCTGTLVVSTAVAAGEFSYRNQGGFPVNPGTVCVASPNGGAAQSTTTTN